MDLIRKIPVILPVIATVFITLISYTKGVRISHIYFRMAVSMVIMTIIGVVIKNMATGIKAELESKKDRKKKHKDNKTVKENVNANVSKKDSNKSGGKNNQKSEATDDNQKKEDEFTPMNFNELTGHTTDMENDEIKK